MPGILLTGALDILKATLPGFRKMTFADTQALCKYRLTRLLFEDAVEDAGGGESWATQIRLRDSQGAAWTTLYSGMPISVKNVMGQIGTEWCHLLDRTQTYDIREKWINSGPEKVFDVMSGRMNAQIESVWNLVENGLVFAGQTSTPTADNPPQVKGLEYWIAPCLTSANAPYTDPVGSFGGQLSRFIDGTTTTTIGVTIETNSGTIDRSLAENTRARNWNFTNNGVGDQTFIDQIVFALLNTGFEALPNLESTNGRQGRKIMLFPTRIQADLIKVLNRRGTDDTKGDVNPFMDFKVAGMPGMHCPALDQRAHLPSYCIDTAKIYGRILKGKWMNPMEPVQQPDAPHVYDIPMEGSGMVHCESPRDVGFVTHIPFAA